MKKVLTFVVSLAVALLVAEGVVRLTFRHKDFLGWQAASLKYRSDPCFGWKIVPGEYLQSREQIHINSMGLRGPEIPMAKPPGEFRILVLGGSSTFNNNSAGGRTWPKILEEKLHRRFGRFIRVVNAGTPGYSSYQSAKRLGCELIRYSPDLVLVYHLWNDVKNFSRSDIPDLVRDLEAHAKFNERTTLNIFAGEIPVFDWLTGVSQIAARLRFALLKLIRHINKYDDEGKVREELHESAQQAAVDFYRRNLLDIRDRLAGKGVPLIIVKQGALAASSNTKREKRLIGYRYTGFTHENLLEAYRRGWEVNDALCRAENVSCIAANEKIPPTLEFFRDHVHMTDRGKERLAQAVFEGFTEMEWLVKKLTAARPR